MIVVVPNEVNGLKNAGDNLKTLLENAINEKSLNLKKRLVEIFMPKFKIENQLDLQETLENVSIKFI